MSKTGKTTGSGHPIHTQTSIPTPVHGNPPHVDVQSVHADGRTSVPASGHHRTDPGHMSWGKQAHPGGGKK